MTTQDLIKNLRQLMPLGPQTATLVTAAADRLEELQRLNESIRDEARAEVERLKQALHDARLENSGQAALLERTRPEPSRLEIAAMLLAAMCGSQYTWTNAEPLALRKADVLIAAAREAK